MTPLDTDASPPFEEHQTIIRPATADDAHAIALIHVTSWRETYSGLLPQTMLDNLSVEKREAFWHQLLTPQRSEETHITSAEQMLTLATGTGAFVADVIQGQHAVTIGFACCSVQRTPELAERGYGGEFQSLYILRAYQQLGLGRRLMSHMAAHLLSLSISGAALWVLDNNTRAQHFYEKLGGHYVSKVEDMRGDITLTEYAYGWEVLEHLL